MDTRRTADEDETTMKTTRNDTEKQQGAPSITDDAPILVIFEILKKYEQYAYCDKVHKSKLTIN